MPWRLVSCFVSRAKDSEPIPSHAATLWVSSPDDGAVPTWAMLLLVPYQGSLYSIYNSNTHGWVSLYICSSGDKDEGGISVEQMGSPYGSEAGPGLVQALPLHV